MRLGARYVELDELLRTCDFISVHTPLTPETTTPDRSAESWTSCNPTAVLVNTSRGPVVDEAALGRCTGGGTHLRRRSRRVRGGARGASQASGAGERRPRPTHRQRLHRDPRQDGGASPPRTSWPYCAVRSRRPRSADKEPGDDGAGAGPMGGVAAGAALRRRPRAAGKIAGGPYPLAGPDARERRSARMARPFSTWGPGMASSPSAPSTSSGKTDGSSSQTSRKTCWTMPGDWRRRWASRTVASSCSPRRTTSPRSGTLPWTSSRRAPS